TIGPRTLEIAALGCLRVVRTYAEAGVSQDEKAAHIAALVAALRYRRKGVGKPLTKIGHFTGLVDFGSHALSLCTDSVGTKVLIAKEMRRWDTIGIDCVAMNVNDMICIGAEPLAFVDYVAISAYDQEVARQIGVGLNRGAELANVSVIGGEVAVVPELIREIDLAGTCFGAVLKTKIIDGRAIRPGDVIVGLPSTGIHSNGLTLARRVLADSALTIFDSLPAGGRPGGERLPDRRAGGRGEADRRIPPPRGERARRRERRTRPGRDGPSARPVLDDLLTQPLSAGPLVRRPKGHGDTEEASAVSRGARTRTIGPIDRVGQDRQRPPFGRRPDAAPPLPRGLRGDARIPGRAALHPRRAGHDVPRPPLDDAPVRGFRDREGD